MGKECKRCWIGCVYLTKKDKFLKAAASGKMEQETALEQIDIWYQEAIDNGCDELKKLGSNLNYD